jgi:hypothetical protein
MGEKIRWNKAKIHTQTHTLTGRGDCELLFRCGRKIFVVEQADTQI